MGGGSSLLAGIKSLEPRIREAADQIEADQCLPPDIIAAFRDIGLFRASWPKSFGGSELDYMEMLEAVEELSRYDGSVGWLGTFAGISGMMASHLAPEVIAQMFPSADSVTAGQYAPVGKAERVDGGYRVSGRWSFGSGCRHATALMAGVMVTENGQPARVPDGKVETRMIMIPVGQAEIFLDSWNTSGMRGTGSHDYAVTDLLVPEGQTFSFFDPPRFDGPLYASPMLFLGSHVPMPLGIARAAIDYVVDLAQTKRYPPGPRMLRDDDYAQVEVAQAEAMLGSVRAWTYEVVRDFWATLCRKEEPSARQKALFRLSLVHVSRVALEVVQKMYDVAASSAIKQNSPMDRLMRDILTVCQHRVVSPRMYRPAGKALLGVKIENDPFF
jgi:alkylation response protein AidB-like acyl-CoA dehydrogenase